MNILTNSALPSNSQIESKYQGCKDKGGNAQSNLHYAFIFTHCGKTENV